MAERTYVDLACLQYYDGKIKDYMNNTGNAATATKLATARSLTTKLDSTTAVTFDGSGAQDAIPVTGTLAIGNGGTGANTRLNAVKALTNESVGSNATHFLTITTNWAKAGYTAVADAKTVLGLKSAAYTESSAYATSGHTHSYLPLSGGTLTGNLTFQRTTATRGTAPSSAVNFDMADVKDSAGNRFSLLETSYATDKSCKTSIFAYNSTAATGNNIGSIGIGCNTSGTVYTFAPTPAAADNTTKIATTAFCKDFIKALSISGKTITYTKSTGTTGTLTTQDTTYSAATEDANGLMTKAMVTKLNGITSGAKAFYIKYTGSSQISCTASTWKTYTPSSDGAIRIVKNYSDGAQDAQIRLTSSSGTQIFTAKHANQFNTGFGWIYLPVKNGVTYAFYTTNVDTFKFYFHSRE